ncbi:MAG TPA: hypothetical protein VHM70_24140 [Polyangiaceae bacterium]|jgi:hypothetical protein|nr:hypothetical protein [Polyangiaceae bacterium]
MKLLKFGFALGLAVCACSKQPSETANADSVPANAPAIGRAEQPESAFFDTSSEANQYLAADLGPSAADALSDQPDLSLYYCNQQGAPYNTTYGGCCLWNRYSCRSNLDCNAYNVDPNCNARSIAYGYKDPVKKIRYPRCGRDANGVIHYPPCNFIP